MMLFRHHLDGLSITLADDVQTLLHARQLDALRIEVQGCRVNRLQGVMNAINGDALPREFSKEDLVTLRLANNESPVVKTIIYRWVKEGLVIKIDTNLWQKCQS